MSDKDVPVITAEQAQELAMEGEALSKAFHARTREMENVGSDFESRRLREQLSAARARVVELETDLLRWQDTATEFWIAGSTAEAERDQLDEDNKELTAERQSLLLAKIAAENERDQLRAKVTEANARVEQMKIEVIEACEVAFECARICDEDHGIMPANGADDAVRALSNRLFDAQHDRDQARAKADQLRADLAHAKRELEQVSKLSNLVLAENERMKPVYEAAKAWRLAEHTGDSNCRAGDCDDCEARACEIALGAAIDVVLDAEIEAAIANPIDDESRCAVCCWPLAATANDGCVRGNCSMRPRPERLYAPDRAAKEAARG